MSDRDRPTPRDPMQAVPRPGRLVGSEREDAQRLIREATSAARKASGDRAPQRPPDRSKTPESGGVEAQRGRIPNVVIDSLPPPSPESKAPTRADWSKLAYKLAAALVGAAVLVIGALGLRWVAAIEAKTDEAKAGQRRAEDAISTRDLEWRTWAQRVRAIEDCREQRNAEDFARLLPDPQKMGAALRPQPFDVSCPTEWPKPP